MFNMQFLKHYIYQCIEEKENVKFVREEKIEGLGLNEKEMESILEFLSRNQIEFHASMTKQSEIQQLNSLFSLYQQSGQSQEALIEASMKIVSRMSSTYSTLFLMEKEELESYGHEILMMTIKRATTNGLFYDFLTHALRENFFQINAKKKGMKSSLYQRYYLYKEQIESETGKTLEEDFSLLDEIVSKMVSAGLLKDIEVIEFKKKILSQMSTEISSNHLEDNSLEEVFLRREVREKLKEALFSLNEVEREVILRRIVEQESRSSIANHFHKKEWNIRDIETLALKKLRHPRISREFREEGIAYLNMRNNAIR